MLYSGLIVDLVDKTPQIRESTIWDVQFCMATSGQLISGSRFCPNSRIIRVVSKTMIITPMFFKKHSTAIYSIKICIAFVKPHSFGQ